MSEQPNTAVELPPTARELLRITDHKGETDMSYCHALIKDRMADIVAEARQQDGSALREALETLRRILGAENRAVNPEWYVEGDNWPFVDDLNWVIHVHRVIAALAALPPSAPPEKGTGGVE